MNVFKCQSCRLILIDRMGASMQLPGAAAWVPQTPNQLTPASTPNSAMPQAIAYPTMQQFQVSPQVNLFTFASNKIPCFLSIYFSNESLANVVGLDDERRNKHFNLINFLKIYVLRSVSLAVCFSADG